LWLEDCRGHAVGAMSSAREERFMGFAQGEYNVLSMILLKIREASTGKRQVITDLENPALYPLVGNAMATTE